MAIRNRIRYWRHKLNIQEQLEFAQVVDVNPFFVERWEQQKIQPSLETFCKIRDRLKRLAPEITLDDLIEYDPD